MDLSFKQIREMLQAEHLSPDEDRRVRSVVFDTRRISHPEQALFIALKGAQDGHKYIPDAYAKGIRNFIIEKKDGIENYTEANFIFCKNSLETLQEFGAKYRRQFSFPVIGLTGSNGKTVVKEWLYQLLEKEFHVWRSPRSFNSQLGVALSVLGLDRDHQLGIIEAGISQKGEMARLEKMIHPNLGVITSLGSAHAQGFENDAEKVREKVLLFENSDVLVFPNDNTLVREAVGELKKKNPLLQTLGWGYEEGAKFRILSTDATGNSSKVVFQLKGQQVSYDLPFADKASIENSMSCICVLYALERLDPEMLQGLEHLMPVANRLVFSEGRQGNYIINDSYSNDPESLEVALDFMQRQQPGMPHTAILTDFAQTKGDKSKIYARVAALLKEKNVEQVFAIGADLLAHSNLFPSNTQYFKDGNTLLKAKDFKALSHRAILVKGARKYGLEVITEQLRKKLHKTYLEIDLDAIRQNYTGIKKLLDPETKLMAMVKAFGYGSGSFEAARTLQFLGVDYLTVAFADEGVALRKAGIKTPVMVLNTGADEMQMLWEHNLEPVVFSRENLQEYLEREWEGTLKIHLELDSGMHRLGFMPGEIAGVFDHLPDTLKVASIFSHLSASEDAGSDAFTQKQINIFRGMCAEIETALGYPVLKHIANTGGILRFAHAQFDMVRLGIGLYGIDPSGKNSHDLIPVTSLKTSISQVKEIPAGDSVGYSRKGVSDKARRIAILPIGYADGLNRKLGNGAGAALIRGQKAPYIGSICMDMCMVDVTGLDCAEGDEAEIFGKQVPVEELAAVCGTISYEILTGISERVRREYAGEN